jgi:hypothetical protein
MSAEALARVVQPTDDIAALSDPVADDPAVGCAAEAMVAQVVREHVVPGVVQDLESGTRFTSNPLPLAAQIACQGSRWAGTPDRLKEKGWLISFADPGAGMNQPSSGTPSRAGKVTFSYSRPTSDGQCSTGARRLEMNPSVNRSSASSDCSRVGVWVPVMLVLLLDSWKAWVPSCRPTR